MTEKQPGKRGPKPVIDDEGRRYESAADAARAIGCGIDVSFRYPDDGAIPTPGSRY